MHRFWAAVTLRDFLRYHSFLFTFWVHSPLPLRASQPPLRHFQLLLRAPIPSKIYGNLWDRCLKMTSAETEEASDKKAEMRTLMRTKKGCRRQQRQRGRRDKERKKLAWWSTLRTAFPPPFFLAQPSLLDVLSEPPSSSITPNTRRCAFGVP